MVAAAPPNGPATRGRYLRGTLRGINARVVSLVCVCLRIIIVVKAASYDDRRRARSRHYRIAGRDPSAKRRRGSGGFVNRRPEKIAALELASVRPQTCNTLKYID